MEIALPIRIEIPGIGRGFRITQDTGTEFYFHWVPEGQSGDYTDAVVQTRHVYSRLKENDYKPPNDPLALLVGLPGRMQGDERLTRLVEECLAVRAYQHELYESPQRILASSLAFFLNTLFASVSIVNDKDWLRSKLQMNFRDSETNELNDKIVRNLMINGSKSPFYKQFSESTNFLIGQLIDRNHKIVEEGFNLSVLGQKSSDQLTLLLASLGLAIVKPEEHEQGVDYAVKFLRPLS